VERGRLRRAGGRLIWGARNGVQFALTFVALKALPVLILGGFDVGAGRDRRRPDHRRFEKLAEVYLGPFVGGGIEGWFAYVLALLFLLCGPKGCSARSTSIASEDRHS
jgi:branched-chain amino acid transport system permease protein